MSELLETIKILQDQIGVLLEIVKTQGESIKTMNTVISLHTEQIASHILEGRMSR